MTFQKRWPLIRGRNQNFVKNYSWLSNFSRGVASLQGGLSSGWPLKRGSTVSCNYINIYIVYLITRTWCNKHPWPHLKGLSQRVNVTILSLNLYVWMYVCMHVCMHVCMSVYKCMYESICLWMYVCMYVCVHVCMYACMYKCIRVCMYVCVYVCMNICLCVCLCIYVCVYMYVYIESSFVYLPPYNLPLSL